MLVTNYLIENDQYTLQLPRDEKKLDQLRKSLSESMVKWMKMIAESNRQAMENYSKDKRYIQKNIWYAEDHLKACQDCQQPQMVKYIINGNYQLIGRLSPTHFDRIEDKNNPPLNFRQWHFVAKKTVIASEALKEAINGLSIIDCGMACQIARYGALQDVLGDKFDRLFGSSVGQPINIGWMIDDELQPMRYFTHYTQASQNFGIGQVGDRPVKKGQTLGIKGVDGYEKKYPYGVGVNFNVVCNDDTPGRQTFIGLGLDPKGETELAICKWLLNDYNEFKNPFFMGGIQKMNPHLESLKFKRIEEADPMLVAGLKFHFDGRFHPAQQVKGFNQNSPKDFIAEVIYDLIELPLEEVTMDFVKKHSTI